MKLNDILKESADDRDDIRKEIWNEDYFEFYEEIRDIIEDIPEKFSNNDRARDVYNHFIRDFSDFENARVSKSYSDAIGKAINNVMKNMDTLDSTIQGLNNFKDFMSGINMYYDADELDVDEQIDDTLEYRRDPYSYYGMSRSDF